MLNLKESLKQILKNSSMVFILLMGLASLFADITYEGARSIIGPFLAQLGANAAIIGFVAGLGELLGYGLRIASGYLVDKTQRYWTITIIGYLINLLAVPALALVGHTYTAAVLVLLERIGKAIRLPARDTMLSHAAKNVGAGWGFGLHEALDRIGAMLGPFIVSLILYINGEYRLAFAVLLIPALITIIILFFARKQFPLPQHLEGKSISLQAKGIDKTFWLYILGSGLIGAGYVDFPLMAFHFWKHNIFSSVQIPLCYMFAVGISAVAAIVFGKLFDKKGFAILVLTSMVAVFSAPLVFIGGGFFIFLGLSLWSIGLGVQGSLMRAVVSNMIIVNKRGTAFGLFNTGFGLLWFLGSAMMGVLYDYSMYYLVIFSMITQLIGAMTLFFVMKKVNHLG